MSLKENIDMVKSELSSEEKFFEKAVMTERFFKKYKKIMIGSVVVIAALVGANLIYEANQEERVLQANKALSALQADAADAQALQELKANSKNLYNVWLYAQAVANKDQEKLAELAGLKTPIMSDLAQYESAKSAAELERYAATQGAIYRDLALVQSAIIFMKEKQIDKAQQKLALISEDSSFYNLAKALAHYGVE